MYLLLFWTSNLVAQVMSCVSTSDSLVLAFLDRYLSTLNAWDNQEISLSQKIQDDGFTVIEGDLKNISKFDTTSTITINRHNNETYEVVLSSNEILLHVIFPMKYELILGLSQNEIETTLSDRILSAKSMSDYILPELNDTADPDGIYYSEYHNYSELSALTDCSYFIKKDDIMLPVMDSLHAFYSLTNMFKFPIEGFDFPIMIQQNIYGFKHLEYSIMLSQWINYCYAEHLNSYVAIEEEMMTAWKILIVAENKELSYNHLVSLIVPKSIFTNQDVTVQAKVNAFIPTDNVAHSSLNEKEQ